MGRGKLLSNNSLFSIDSKKYAYWKKYSILCKTPGMTSWMGLEHLRNNLDIFSDYYPKTIYPRKYNKFPARMIDCRCRNCRYHRIFHKCQIT